jgi:uncharacterized protein YecE (DUF72 family)
LTDQLSLFGTELPVPPDPSVVRPVEVRDELRFLAEQLGPNLHLGTSSWFFPGWTGIVYANGSDSRVLAREGLTAYSAHPLLRTVSIDRSYYAPLDREVFEGYAAQVPEDFRFTVKAPAECTTPYVRGADGYPAGDNPHFLDPEYAYENFVRPAYDGLGPKCGPLLFQFPPQGRAALRHPRQFADRLYAFLSRLPRLPLYAVELRDAPLMTDTYVEALRGTGVRHCLSVHPKAGALHDQTDVLAVLGPGPQVARWNLNPAHTYEEAKERYAPFDRLQQEDPASRAVLASVCARALQGGQPVYLAVNNKAEGSAPLSVFKLAEEIHQRVRRVF